MKEIKNEMRRFREVKKENKESKEWDKLLDMIYK